MTTSLTSANAPWQLEMFRRSLKKQLKLEAMLELLGDVHGQECLLVTCGDNNGALNWHFREHGGRWTWADASDEDLSEMSCLLGETVHRLSAEDFPFADNAFDCVVSIDVLEHLPDEQPFLQELYRVTRPEGTALVTVPNGDPCLLANRIKQRVGMTPQVYGHVRAGYTAAELRAVVEQAGFTPRADGGYSRFFTEMVELLINFGYVFMLSRKKGGATSGHIAPATSGELKTHSAAYRLYSLFYPLLKLISKLDGILPPSTDNAVIVKASKA